MVDDEKKSFAEMMRATLGIYEKEVTKETLLVWWNSLSAYSFEVVREAFSRHVQDKDRGRFSPKPADIIGFIDAMIPDGRPGVEEAWAMWPHDELSSAVVSNEMAEAMQVASQLLDEGDKIGARMAFKEAYTRIVSNNKMQGIKPTWFASLGHSPEGREIAVKEAVRLGRLTKEHAITLLPYKETEVVNNAVALLSDNSLTPEQKQIGKEKIQKIKLMLKPQD